MGIPPVHPEDVNRVSVDKGNLFLWLAVTFVAGFVAGMLLIMPGAERKGLYDGSQKTGSELCARQGARFIDGRCFKLVETDNGTGGK